MAAPVDLAQRDKSAWPQSITNNVGANMFTYSYAGDAGKRGSVTTRSHYGASPRTWNFTVDQGNRISQVTGWANETYSYDGNGRRTTIQVGANPKTFQIYSQGGKLLQVGATGAVGTERYLYLGAHLVAKVLIGSGGTTTVRYLHTDGVGSPVAESDASGTLIAGSRQLSEPYGLVSFGTPTQGPGFTCHVYDAQTGLNYMQQRYYDPVAGRFLSVDPVVPDEAKSEVATNQPIGPQHMLYKLMRYIVTAIAFSSISLDANAQKHPSQVVNGLDPCGSRIPRTNYEVVVNSDLSVAAMDRSMSTYTHPELTALPTNERRELRIVITGPITRSTVDAAMRSSIDDIRCTQANVDEIAVLAYDRKEDVTGAYTLGRLEWAPAGGWGGVSAEIARSNNRNGYRYISVFTPRVDRIEPTQPKPTDREVKIHDDVMKYLDANPDVEEDILMSRLSKKYGLSVKQIDDIVIKVKVYRNF